MKIFQIYLTWKLSDFGKSFKLKPIREKEENQSLPRRQGGPKKAKNSWLSHLNSYFLFDKSMVL